jgi:rod shape-determining protein MreC
MAALANGLEDFGTGVVRAPSLRRKVAELQATVDLHAHDALIVSQLQTEIDDLRKLQRFEALPGRMSIPASVIGMFPFTNRVTLNVGSRQGVTPNLAVMAPQGLFAVVQTVSQDRCQAQLIFSPTTNIGAKALRKPPAAGLLRGETASSLIVEFLDPDSPVAVDDVVVTSGYSEFIPENLPIGIIWKLEDNTDFGTRRAVVLPYVSLGNVRDVVIIK